MKNSVIITIVMLISSTVDAYQISTTVSGAEKKWPDGQIDIHLDRSLDEQYGDGTIGMIEESFLTWLDYIDSDLALNFIESDCEADFTKNCVLYSEENICTGVDSAACARSIFYRETGEITAVNIVFTPITYRNDLKNIIMHEIGHFFGMGHSSNHDAIMYEHVTDATELHQDDINGIMTLYGDGTVFPSIAAEPIDYHFMGCSVSQTVSAARSIFNLIF